MSKKKSEYKLPIESTYYYDARSTLSSRKADFKGHSKTPHGAKKAAYAHLDKDYGDAKRVIIIDLRTGVELWNMHLLSSGTVVINEVSAKTQQVVKTDIKVMKQEGKRF